MRNANLRRFLVPMLAAAAVFGMGAAAAEEELGAVALDQALKDVGTDLRLMCMAAHPDDEDSTTLAKYRKKYGYKTFAVLATRGEGGQNEIGPELYEELGVIRTHEMLRASEITGAEFHCLNLLDFGYSKSRDETYDFWGEEETLRRTVRILRKLRPDVIITHHDPTGGHGHHQAIGKSLQDAFDVSGDPTVFPEQIKEEGLEPWQPARLFVRSWSGSENAKVIDAGELDPVRGITYATMAGRALYEHESQGMGMFVDRFIRSRRVASYELVKEAPSKHQDGTVPAPGGSLFEGLDDRVSPEAREVSEAGTSGDVLGRALELITNTGPPRAEARAARLAQVAAEISLHVEPSDEELVPGQTIELDTLLRDFKEADVSDVTFTVETPPWENASLPDGQDAEPSENQEAEARLSVGVPANEAPTIPHAEHLYDADFLDPQIHVVARATVRGTEVPIRKPVLVDVAPDVSLTFLDGPYLVQNPKDGYARFDLEVQNHTPGAVSATIELDSPEGFSLERKAFDIAFDREGARRVIPIDAKVGSGVTAGDYTLAANVQGEPESEEGTARVVDVAVPDNIRVGVVQSYDDTFMKTLERFDVPHEALEIRDFTPDRLDEFSTIILDIRTYRVRPDVVAANQALLDYVERGGTLLVMYHKTFEWEPEFAPYPIKLSRNRVTVEEAPMEILVPDHPLFNTPNEIGGSDWDGWIQERGLYFPAQWDEEHYTPLIDVADPGEDPPPGSVLIAEYGDGTYLYTALGWYRQLRELHPGTLRVFANMLAL